MIKQLLNSVIAKNIVICQCLADQLFASAFGFGKLIIDLLATVKSRYFAQPRPIIVNYLCQMYLVVLIGDTVNL